MNHTTKEFLRSAVVDALTKGNDESALEILSILQTNQPTLSITTVPALPAKLNVTAKTSHSVESLTRIVRLEFLPYLQQNGRTSFKSVELRRWIQCNVNINLTQADWELLANGRPRWKKTISAVLAELKKTGILGGKQNCQSYAILR